MFFIKLINYNVEGVESLSLIAIREENVMS